jgi:hypothetical protein
MGRRGIGSNGAGSGAAGANGSPARSGSQAAPGQTGSRAAPKKPGHGATYSVGVMTLAALAGVGVLAAQAAATAPKVSANASAKASASAHQQGRPTPSGADSASPAPDPLALPANSGTGLRIVYGEAARRVWLVSDGSTVARTFQVVPGNVAAPTGSFKVTTRLSTSSGTDGTPIQYVVLFNNARVGHVSATFGFDAVANVTGLPPAPSGRTGGIRMAQADAQALWNFSNFGTTVVVVP